METAGLRERLQDSLGGAYTLDRELAGGGMSRVFVARDASLGRDVVVKVLPPDAAAALSAQRFEREIAFAARLQHPHIVPVLSAGVTADGLPYYTMPLVEGESLRARLTRAGELPVAEAVAVLEDVARALAYAHARGVVHRDIKPDNVLLSGGVAVVTDFGVAKAVTASTTAGDATSLTQLGVALGTPAYMAPEQVAADPATDHRADLYALGCVAYELLTGQPPFTGRPVQALLAAQVSEAPEPVQRRRPNVPPALAALVMRCLEKRPADRPASADDVLRALESAATPSGTPALPRHATRTSTGPRLVALMAGVAATAGALGWALHRPAPDDEAPVVRFALAMEPDEQPWEVGCSSFALSDDGRVLAYSALKAGVPTLRVRASDRIEARTVEGLRAPRCPAVSPDGRWIALGTGSDVRRIAVDGGATMPLGGGVRVAGPSGRVGLTGLGGLTWATMETLVISDGITLWALPSDGGPARRLSSSDTTHGERGRFWPRALPSGHGVLYASWSDATVESARIGVISLDGKRSTVLDLPGMYPVGVAGGRLVYVDVRGAVKAVPFDVERWRVTGAPQTVVEHVDWYARGATSIALSPNGTLVYLSGHKEARAVLVDRRGGRRPLPVDGRPYANPRFSPDGSRIAFGVGAGAVGTGIWIYDFAAGTLSRLTTGGFGSRPEWTADGRRVLYIGANPGGETALWWQPADGSGQPSLLLATPDDVFEGTLTRDGRTLVYRTGVRGAVRDIFAMSMEGDRTPRPLVVGPANETMPRLSPDGRWLAYMSDESGVQQIYVRPFPDPGGRTQVSVDGGMEPVWSRDGAHLFYRAGRRLVDAAVRTGPTFGVVSRAALFEGDFDVNSSHPNYDVAPDGEHFLMLERAGTPQQVVVVHNWVREISGANR